MQVTVGENSNSYDTLLDPLPQETFTLGNVNDEMLALFALGNIGKKNKANLESFLMTFPNKKKRREVLLQCCIMKSILDSTKNVKRKNKKKTKSNSKKTKVKKLSYFYNDNFFTHLAGYLNSIKSLAINKLKIIKVLAFIIFITILLYLSLTLVKGNFSSQSKSTKENYTQQNSNTSLDELNSLTNFFRNKLTLLPKENAKVISKKHNGAKVVKTKENKSSITLTIIGVFSFIFAIFITIKITQIKRNKYLENLITQDIKQAQTNANKEGDDSFSLNYIDEQIKTLKQKKKKKIKKQKEKPIPTSPSLENNNAFDENLLFLFNENEENSSLSNINLDNEENADTNLNETSSKEITNTNNEDDLFSEEDLDLIAEQYLNNQDD